MKYKSTMHRNFPVNLPDSGKLHVPFTTDREEYCVQGKTDYQYRQKSSIPAVTQFHRMLKNDRDAREGKGLVPSTLTKCISQLLTVRSGEGGLQIEL